ncbi:MAG: cellulase family glycosylhydrolase [Patescibacteria group bacterium]|jgi:hypothetical protein|nr:cellulase family glycosylhydrolase [Patescibacteria group bacterium]
MSHRGKILFLVFIVIVLNLIIFMKIFANNKNYDYSKFESDFLGVTFSRKYAEELGLDWREVYLAIINDLEVKEIRLPIYWDEIEKEKGVFNYKDYDYMISEGAKRDVKFVISVGWRLPRWPECHAPNWTNQESISDTQKRTLIMIEKTVNRYKDNSSIVYWQLENEPFLDFFGICPPSDEEFFKQELKLLKSLDKRPVMVSGPGELNFWIKESRYGDVFGTTMYRVVWNRWLGYTRYPIPPWFYRLKAWLVNIPVEKRIIAELQAEPWVPQGKIIHLSQQEASYSFDIDQFKDNLEYARRTRFKKAYLWGVEWWYWQYKHDNKIFWEFARTLF